MGFPQISDRVRMAPMQALRAVFAGIGRILLTADRPEGRTTTADRRGSTVSAGHPASWPQHAGPASQAAARWRDLDKTGNVRLLTAEDMAIEFGIDRQVAVTTGTAHDATVHELKDAISTDLSAAASAPAPAAELPLAGYDDLSLPSIRARLRGLDVSQLRILADYERTHAERADVLGMFERRIDKLEAGA